MVSSKVMVLGSGSREHALATALTKESHAVVVVPGNAGTAEIARNVLARLDDFAALVRIAKEEKPDLIVVGPEVPLVLGVTDALTEQGFVVFGPSKAAARLEGSKAFMKQFLARHAIPTAAFQVFDDPDRAEAFVKKNPRPLVVKTDGLAAGKGVVVATTQAEALAAINAMMRDRVFGDAGRTVIIEEVLPGEEASFHVLCDGAHAVPLAAAQDHKRIFDGDRGPNTGGMGAYAPAPIITESLQAEIMDHIVTPTLIGMATEGSPFRGVLFVGLMIERNSEGLVPRVLEFNVRFGDPETCVLLPLYEGHVFDLLLGSAKGSLPSVSPAPKGHALCVVMAAEGYPAKPVVGDEIQGVSAPLLNDAFVCHAGTTRVANGNLVTAGGRVLAVGAVGSSLQAAHDHAYDAVRKIIWRGEQHRNDIGHRALKSMKASS